MKLVIAIVSGDDSNKVQKALIKENFFVTRLQTTSGFLRSKNSTFLIGVNDEHVPRVLEIIEDNSKKRSKLVPSAIIDEFGEFGSIPSRVEVGGATIFVLSVDQFLKI